MEIIRVAYLFSSIDLDGLYPENITEKINTHTPQKRNGTKTIGNWKGEKVTSVVKYLIGSF